MKAIEDRTAGKSQPHTPLPATEVNWRCVDGIVLEYRHASEEQLLAAGLVTRDMLPGVRYKCASRGDYGRLGVPHWELHRCKDGTLNARFEADHVLSGDVAFKRFLGGILADTRLSLVSREQPSQ